MTSENIIENTNQTTSSETNIHRFQPLNAALMEFLIDSNLFYDSTGDSIPFYTLNAVPEEGLQVYLDMIPETTSEESLKAFKTQLSLDDDHYISDSGSMIFSAIPDIGQNQEEDPSIPLYVDFNSEEFAKDNNSSRLQILRRSMTIVAAVSNLVDFSKLRIGATVKLTDKEGKNYLFTMEDESIKIYNEVLGKLTNDLENEVLKTENRV